MKREEVEETNNGNLTDLQGNKNLLVSFGGVYQGLGIPVFEFFNSISDIECDKIFLRDFHQAWYHKGVDSSLDDMDKVIEFLRSTIRRNKYEKVCFLGNSMGGYAALLFGSILKVNSVISFAPQTFINKRNRIINYDRRWKKQISDVHSSAKKKNDFLDIKDVLSENESSGTSLNIFYSPAHRLDKKHAERLKKLKNVILHPVSEGGHEVVKTIRNNGELKLLIKSTFEI